MRLSFRNQILKIIVVLFEILLVLVLPVDFDFLAAKKQATNYDYSKDNFDANTNANTAANFLDTLNSNINGGFNNSKNKTFVFTGNVLNNSMFDNILINNYINNYSDYTQTSSSDKESTFNSTQEFAKPEIKEAVTIISNTSVVSNIKQSELISLTKVSVKPQEKIEVDESQIPHAMDMAFAECTYTESEVDPHNASNMIDVTKKASGVELCSGPVWQKCSSQTANFDYNDFKAVVSGGATSCVNPGVDPNVVPQNILLSLVNNDPGLINKLTPTTFSGLLSQNSGLIDKVSTADLNFLGAALELDPTLAGKNSGKIFKRLGDNPLFLNNFPNARSAFFTKYEILGTTSCGIRSFNSNTGDVQLAGNSPTFNIYEIQDAGGLTAGAGCSLSGNTGTVLEGFDFSGGSISFANGFTFTGGIATYSGGKSGIRINLIDSTLKWNGLSITGTFTATTTKTLGGREGIAVDSKDNTLNISGAGNAYQMKGQGTFFGNGDLYTNGSNLELFQNGHTIKFDGAGEYIYATSGSCDRIYADYGDTAGCFIDTGSGITIVQRKGGDGDISISGKPLDTLNVDTSNVGASGEDWIRYYVGNAVIILAGRNSGFQGDISGINTTITYKDKIQKGKAGFGNEILTMHFQGGSWSVGECTGGSNCALAGQTMLGQLQYGNPPYELEKKKSIWATVLVVVIVIVAVIVAIFAPYLVALMLPSLVGVGGALTFGGMVVAGAIAGAAMGGAVALGTTYAATGDLGASFSAAGKGVVTGAITGAICGGLTFLAFGGTVTTAGKAVWAARAAQAGSSVASTGTTTVVAGSTSTIVSMGLQHTVATTIASTAVNTVVGAAVNTAYSVIVEGQSLSSAWDANMNAENLIISALAAGALQGINSANFKILDYVPLSSTINSNSVNQLIMQSAVNAVASKIQGKDWDDILLDVGTNLAVYAATTAISGYIDSHFAQESVKDGSFSASNDAQTNVKNAAPVIDKSNLYGQVANTVVEIGIRSAALSLSNSNTTTLFDYVIMGATAAGQRSLDVYSKYLEKSEGEDLKVGVDAADARLKAAQKANDEEAIAAASRDLATIKNAYNDWNINQAKNAQAFILSAYDKDSTEGKLISSDFNTVATSASLDTARNNEAIAQINLAQSKKELDTTTDVRKTEQEISNAKRELYLAESKRAEAQLSADQALSQNLKLHLDDVNKELSQIDNSPTSNPADSEKFASLEKVSKDLSAKLELQNKQIASTQIDLQKESVSSKILYNQIVLTDISSKIDDLKSNPPKTTWLDKINPFSKTVDDKITELDKQAKQVELNLAADRATNAKLNIQEFNQQAQLGKSNIANTAYKLFAEGKITKEVRDALSLKNNDGAAFDDAIEYLTYQGIIDDEFESNIVAQKEAVIENYNQIVTSEKLVVSYAKTISDASQNSVDEYNNKNWFSKLLSSDSAESLSAKNAENQKQYFAAQARLDSETLTAAVLSGDTKTIEDFKTNSVDILAAGVYTLRNIPGTNLATAIDRLGNEVGVYDVKDKGIKFNSKNEATIDTKNTLMSTSTLYSGNEDGTKQVSVNGKFYFYDKENKFLGVSSSPDASLSDEPVKYVKRGFFGSLFGNEYFDPKTGNTISAEEYNNIFVNSQKIQTELVLGTKNLVQISSTNAAANIDPSNIFYADSKGDLISKAEADADPSISVNKKDKTYIKNGDYIYSYDKDGISIGISLVQKQPEISTEKFNIVDLTPPKSQADLFKDVTPWYSFTKVYEDPLWNRYT